MRHGITCLHPAAVWRILSRRLVSRNHVTITKRGFRLTSAPSPHSRPFSVSLKHLVATVPQPQDEGKKEELSSTVSPPANYDQAQKLANAARIANYVFRNPESWLWEALQSAGSPVIDIGGRAVDEGNKRLALLGDKVIGLIIVQIAIEENTYRVVVDRRMQAMAVNKNFAAVCDRIGLTDCINLNPCNLGLAGKHVKASTVEALIGAVFLDSGKSLDAAQRVMSHIRIFEAVGAAKPVIQSGDALDQVGLGILS